MLELLPRGLNIVLCIIVVCVAGTGSESLKMGKNGREGKRRRVLTKQRQISIGQKSGDTLIYFKRSEVVRERFLHLAHLRKQNSDIVVRNRISG